MSSIKDDRGYNQGFQLVKSTLVRMRRRAEWIISEMGDASGKSVLEIGCGTGEVSNWIAEKTGAQVLGTDLCEPFIAEAKNKYRRENLNYKILDFSKSGGLEEERFDYIVGNGILHHLYLNLDDVLLTMRSLLKENGKIIFLEPNYCNPYIFLTFSVPMLRRYTRLEPDEMAFTGGHIDAKLRKAGFSEISVDYKDFLLPGVPEWAIAPSIVVGDIIEKVPILQKLSQSIFIRATQVNHARGH